jgi:hypothetical protein
MLNMVGYHIYDVYILLYKCPSCNYSTIPWFFNVAFYLLILHISMGQL